MADEFPIIGLFQVGGVGSCQLNATQQRPRSREAHRMHVCMSPLYGVESSETSRRRLGQVIVAESPVPGAEKSLRRAPLLHLLPVTSRRLEQSRRRSSRGTRGNSILDGIDVQGLQDLPKYHVGFHT